nr:MAG TPA: Ribosome associated membrane protein RAMP4 [Caudoviricetes sp.]
MNKVLEWFIVGLLLVIFGSVILELGVNAILGSVITYIAVFAVIADYMEW